MLIDPERLSYALYKLIPDETEMIEKENPEIIMKSVKNDIETEHIRRAHLKDAAAIQNYILAERKYRENRDYRNGQLPLV